MDIWKEMISKLATVPFHPRQEDEVLLHRFNGVPLLRVYTMDALEAMKNFEVREDDLFLITYAKAGTTWAQEIVSMILNGGDEEALKDMHLFFRFPFLEMNWASHYSQCDQIPSVYTILDKAPSPRTMKTHLSGNNLPPQVYTKKPKIIYVARNPKDTAVSYYFMHRRSNVLPFYHDWDTFFLDFVKGEVHVGSWFDHTLFWWQKRNEPNVLFLKYEDMKRDLRASVAQIAKFLGSELSSDTLDLTTEHCSFNSMKKNRFANPDFLHWRLGEANDAVASSDASSAGDGDDVRVETKQTERKSFLRKGIVGDWKNYFTVAQNEMFDAEYNERMAGSGLYFDFESHIDGK